MKRNSKNFFRRGQVMALYALLIPLLFLFVGAGLDLGWYYLNVSRLQNAADAAAIAGAQQWAADINSQLNPTTTTSTSTETSGNTTTTTTTTTTITTTCHFDKLIKTPESFDLYEDNSKALTDYSKQVARDYVVNNLSEETTDEKIIDSWSKGGDPEVTPEYHLYKNDDKFYYVVELKENIEHFLLSGWFEPMKAPVTSVALLSEGSSSETWIDKVTNILEKAKNKNVIIGNWEVQNYYRELNSGGYTVTLNKGDVLIDSNGEAVLDENGNPVITDKKTTVKINRSKKFSQTFGSEVYTNAWNHFQDFKNHYYLGDLYRKQLVIVKDDVVFNKNESGTNYVDLNKTRGTITGYGAGKYGESSSVAATAASINEDADSTAYNPKHSGARKTYQEGITESADVGYPYTWQVLDSINIDFRPEVVLSGKWLSEDWDLELDDFDGVTFNDNKKWTTSGDDKKEDDANKIKASDIRRMRIHTSINFENPYKVRPYVETDTASDILWARIESEPVLNHPDVTNASNALNLSSSLSVTGLNSVNQIILNFNQSNISEVYRPVVIFYDGPETNSSLSGYDKSKFVRKSKPVIVNLNAPYRVILYAPNSPVVVIGDNKNDLKGFIMAKKYMRLKDDDDFIAAEDYLRKPKYSDEDFYKYAFRYFIDVSRKWEYTRKKRDDGTVYYTDWPGTGTNASSKVPTDEAAYRLRIYYARNDPETDLSKKKRYYKIYGKTPNAKAATTSAANTYETVDGMKYIKVIEENGIDMYVDEHGDIQCEELSSPPADCGTYDTFGITELTIQNYQVNESSATNMLISGK